MTTFKYDPNNTEGHWPTAMVVENAELKKGNKIVATDIIDLYDTDINNPQDQEALTYTNGKWVNGNVTGGSKCTIFTGYNGYTNVIAKKISCGSNHTLAIKEDGTLWGTGDNYHGQLGLGDTHNRSVFTQIGTDNDWKQVSCGNAHTLAIKEDGTLWATGYNHYGQLGIENAGLDIIIFTQVGTDNDWKQVSCGFEHSLAIKEDGTLWATGSNWYGQLGINSPFFLHNFTQIGTDTDWKQVDCGGYHTLAIKEDGTLWATGLNDKGQLGLGDNINRNVFTQIGTDTDWKQVACGSRHTLVAKENDTLQATGWNASGQLGLGDNSDRNVFTQIGTDTDWKQVDCGGYHTLAIKEDGTLWATGLNDKGQLGLGDNINRNVFTQIGTDTDWKQVACGSRHTLVAKENDTLQATGWNASGQLGLGDYIDRYEYNDVKMIAINSLFIDKNIYGNGRNGTYEKPFNTLKETFEWLRNTCINIPEEITLKIQFLSDVYVTENTSLNHPYGNNITIEGNGFKLINQSNIEIELIQNDDENVVFDSVLVDAGGLYSMSIKPNKTLWGTGINNYGQLGLSNYYYDPIFMQEITYNNWKEISCGADSTLAIKEDGTLWATGRNNYGQLGLGDNSDRNIFTQVGTDTDWKQVDCGDEHTLAIKEDGTLWATGRNNRGQLGLGYDPIKYTFTQVGTDTDWKQVSCGNAHTLVIKDNGTLWATGLNTGQLGLGYGPIKYTFTQVGTDTDWKQVSCGNAHTLVIKDNGTLWATGYNLYGQLGLGDNLNKTVFTQVGTDTDWKQVSCGSQHTLAIKNNGTLWATGINNYGQLGLCNNSNRNTFTQIGTDTDWKQVSCGSQHTLAIKNNGTLWGTGRNNYGQLGLDDNSNRNTFTQVTYPKIEINSITTEPKIILNNNKIIFRDIDIIYDITVINDDYLPSQTIDVNIYHILAKNNSILQFENITNDDTNIITIIKLKNSTKSCRINFSKIPILLEHSTGVIKKTIPSNIICDMKSTIDVPDLQYDINNWQIKNDTSLIINTELNPLIDVNNENSTIIVNDAQV